MCIIIAQKAGREISYESMKNSWNRNNDGAGIMYAIDGVIHIKKELKDFEAFYRFYKELVTERPDLNIVVHYRIGTSGKMNKANCHPFRVHEDLAFCHNGVIDIKMPKDSKHSDTVEFNKSILQMLPENFLEYGVLRRLIRPFIGHSKLCFLDANGNVTIIKEKLGNWEKGIWYSNDSHKTPRYTNYYNQQAYTGHFWDYNEKGQLKNTNSAKGIVKTTTKKAKQSSAQVTPTTPTRGTQAVRSSGLLSNPAGNKTVIAKTQAEKDTEKLRKEIKDTVAEVIETAKLVSQKELDDEWAENSKVDEQTALICNLCETPLQYTGEINSGYCADCFYRESTRNEEADLPTQAQMIEAQLREDNDVNADFDLLDLEEGTDEKTKEDKSLLEHHKEFVARVTKQNKGKS